MASLRHSIPVSPFAYRASSRLRTGRWLYLSSGQRWVSTENQPTAEPSDQRGAAFDQLMSKLDKEYNTEAATDSAKPEVSEKPVEQTPKTPVSSSTRQNVPKPNGTRSPADSNTSRIKSADGSFRSGLKRPTFLSRTQNRVDDVKKNGSDDPKPSSTEPKEERRRTLSRPSSTDHKGDRDRASVSISPRETVRIDCGHKRNPFRYYDPLFLRDSCDCPKCVDPSTRQKLFATTDISPNIKVKHMWYEGDVVKLKWSNDLPNSGHDHVTTLSFDFLNRSHNKVPVSFFRGRKSYWHSADFERSPWKTLDYNDYMSDDRFLLRALQQLHSHGLLFLRNVPETESAVSDIATRIGPLKNTFYGSTWDVRSVAEAKNVAYTSQDLGFHMDLLYMQQPPRLQFLHCLKASAEGGTSLFTDSYKAVETLYNTKRDFFMTLADKDVNFHYDNDSQHYWQSRRVIELVGTSQDENMTTKPPLQAVNWSPPFQGPFYVKKGYAALAEHVRSWHTAAQAFRDLVESRSAIYRRQMPPGECVIFDNQRVLHARTAFSGGERWLRGCYVDSDPFLSKTRVLFRKYAKLDS